MKHCPACIEEYEDGVEICEDCGAVLHIGPSPAELEPPPNPLDALGEVTSIAIFSSEAEARFLEGVLRSEEIPTQIRRLGSERLDPLMGQPMPGYSILVPPEHAHHAEGVALAIRARRPLAGVTWFPEPTATATFPAGTPTVIDAPPPPSRRPPPLTFLQVLLPIIVCGAIAGFFAQVLQPSASGTGEPSVTTGMSDVEITLVRILFGAAIGLGLAAIWLRRRAAVRRQRFGDD